VKGGNGKRKKGNSRGQNREKRGKKTGRSDRDQKVQRLCKKPEQKRCSEVAVKDVQYRREKAAKIFKRRAKSKSRQTPNEVVFNGQERKEGKRVQEKNTQLKNPPMYEEKELKKRQLGTRGGPNEGKLFATSLSKQQ